MPLIAALQIRGHQLLYRKALAKRLNATGPTDRATIDRAAQAHSEALSATDRHRRCNGSATDLSCRLPRSRCRENISAPRTSTLAVKR